MAELSAENMATPYGKIDEAARPYLSNRLIAKKCESSDNAASRNRSSRPLAFLSGINGNSTGIRAAGWYGTTRIV
jgi:hypothetical protein